MISAPVFFSPALVAAPNNNRKKSGHVDATKQSQTKPKVRCFAVHNNMKQII